MPKKPTKLEIVNYKQHKLKWKDCTACKLCDTRDKIVLLRGRVPAPVLFIGEAPGLAENVLGSPFVGPAGKLLDEMIQLAGLRPEEFAITNLIACAPIMEDRGAIDQPPAFAITACRDRLVEAIRLVSPDLIICVGTYATKWFNEKHLGDLAKIESVSIVHPAAILRMTAAQQGLAYQRAIIQIKDAIVPF